MFLKCLPLWQRGIEGDFKNGHGGTYFILGAKGLSWGVHYQILTNATFVAFHGPPWSSNPDSLC